MDSSSLTVSLLLSLGFMQFVSAADQNNVTINALPGENVILPCEDPNQGKIKIAEWKRNDLGEENVLLYKDGQINPGNQHQSYRDRADLLVGQIEKGNVSLILQNTMTNDSGTYLCQVTTSEGDKLISTVSLVVAPRPPDPLPVWAIVLLVLLVLALVAAAGLVLYSWFRWSPVPEHLEVESGEKFVLLPFKVPRRLWCCKYRIFLPVGKVEWKDRDNRTVHVYQDGSYQPGDQNEFYRTRTKMDENLLKTGDLSLTLSWPTDGDENLYICSVYNKKGNVLMKKQVWLKVKVQQEEVKPGDKSVLLPWTITGDLPGDTKVVWMDGDKRKVHVYQYGSDQPGLQDQFYRTRTKMDKNPLKNINVSLTLEWPTDGDENTFTCRVFNRKGVVLMMKQVHLQVKVPKVEVKPGVESVKLPCRTTEDLNGDTKVVWMDVRDKTVHVYHNGSDQPGEQDQIYRKRTKMDENLLKTKDLSLTLRRPTDGDGGTFTCRVSNRAGVVLMKKQVDLQVKGTIQVQPDDTRTRRNSIDPTPLMADQLV